MPDYKRFSANREKREQELGDHLRFWTVGIILGKWIIVLAVSFTTEHTESMEIFPFIFFVGSARPGSAVRAGVLSVVKRLRTHPVIQPKFLED